MKIATLTMNPAIDKSASAELVAPEIKLHCFDVQRDPGGGGINVSRAIHRMQGDSIAIFPAGGITGDLLKDLMDAEGVKFHAVPIQSLTRENLTVYDELTELQYRFGMPGAVMTEDESQSCLDALATLDPKPEYLVMSGSLPDGVPDDFTQKVARLAADMGAKLIVDTSGDPLKQALDVGAYLIKPNIRELRLLVDAKLKTEAEQEEAARVLVASSKVQVVIVSLGAAGALLVTNDLTERLRAPLVPIKSKVGAGDSMVGGIVHKLASGATILEAAQYGIAAGAAAVMTAGTQLCKFEDVERLYGEIKR
ncbi:MAG: 1-phosphofructokinase family hexose kinase [Chloroflexi bacterium]|nr:1-phosphofructokinase family hexose kinase [Chloroflexota bacterium]